jgi:MarR-like DNA-binding transcriptional regulator SgrR of sgrS sRNA
VPVYGVVFIDKMGQLDLKKTTGPFTLQSAAPNELTLAANAHWYGYQKAMPERVVIRQPKAGSAGDQDGFFDHDPWPNLAASSSLMPAAAERNLKARSYSIWNRHLDRLFFLAPGASLANPSGRKLMQALAQGLDRQVMLSDISGYHLSQQVFPPGYLLHDPEFQEAKAPADVPAEFKSRPLRLLAAEGRVGNRLQANIAAAFKKATGQDPRFTIVPLNKFIAALAAGGYDIGVVTVAVNDPNIEGPVSYLFGFNPPLIPNAAGESGDFAARIVRARGQDERARNAEYRRVFSEATASGCILPLFHFSSIVVARNGMDLSGVPTTDETVAFSKIRFK